MEAALTTRTWKSDEKGKHHLDALLKILSHPKEQTLSFEDSRGIEEEKKVSENLSSCH